MHQRHIYNGAAEMVASTGSDEEDPMYKPSSTVLSNTDESFTKRRRRQVSWWHLSFRPLNKPIKPKPDFPALLQYLFVMMVTACALTFLLSRAIGGGQLDFLSVFGGGSTSWTPRSPAQPYDVGLSAHNPKVPLPPDSYQIPGSMSNIGDKSDHYAMLREEFDAKEDELPDVEPKYQFTPITTDNGYVVSYDIYNCPDHPPSGYPYAWNLQEILKAWPPDDPTPRPQVYQGLCVFDYQKDLEKAHRYRDAELPFVMRNDPQVQKTVKRWNSPDYMQRLLGRVPQRVEYSESNHFMYWRNPPRQAGQQQQLSGWKPPTKVLRMTYEEWLEKANMTDDSKLGPEMPHWYFRLTGCGKTGPGGQCGKDSSEYLFDELPYFQPKARTLYLVDPKEQRGIHCRFGMKGVIAENHFDTSRNAIALLGGERRYILSHPDQCPYLSLFPVGHPSARHSAVDWSKPDLGAYPEFALARGNEVVMQPGDVMYLPSYWFHHIISLSLNFQCNTRSGFGDENELAIDQCGFS